MPRKLKRYYGDGDLHLITFSCYRRMQHLASARRRDLFLRSLEQTRRTYGFRVLGYVVMPEHVHLLVDEPPHRNLSVAMKALKQSVSRRVFRRRPVPAGQLVLFKDSSPRRFWQARFYDFNVYTRKKRIEKLRYMHRNPVKRGLVARPDDWRWSSFRYYAFEEKGVVEITTPMTAALSAKGLQLDDTPT